MTNLQTFKFIFSAFLGELQLKANVSTPTFATWKRSQQSAISQTIDMSAGKADFKNQVLKLPVNMYFDQDAKCFQEKKTSMSFTMKTPKGEKTAGVVYIDLSKMLNNKIQEINEEFPLEKCPVKDSTVRIRITSQCLGQKANDTSSQASINNIGSGSNLSIISVPQSTLSQIQAPPQKKQSTQPQKLASSASTPEKESQIKQLQQKVQQLQKENKSLRKELERTKQSVKGDNVKEEFLKSKALQDRLEEEVNTLKKQNLEHEREIQNVRKKLEETYANLYSCLGKNFI